MLELRPYQAKMAHETRVNLRTHDNVLVQAPTGAGKTVLTAKMLNSASDKGNRSYLIVHRQELVDQSAKTFDKVGIEYGIIAAGYSRNPLPKIQICMIQTLANKLSIVRNPALLVFDEAHHIKSASWQRVRQHFSKAKCVGLTATPSRLDGKGLGDIFDIMVMGPPVAWLMEKGYLADYKYYAPNTPDTSHLHTTAGDFNKKETAELMDNAKIIGDAVSHYSRVASGKSALVFCSSIEHSEHTVEQFRQAGYSAHHIDGTTDKKVRRKLLEDFREKKFEILCNVDLIGEGVDIVGAEVAILLRPTKSLTIYLQQVGRVLRPDPSKPFAIVLDHAGNVFRHGLPDAKRDWKLTFTGQKRRRKKDDEDALDTKQCPECFVCHEPAPICPECGFVYPVLSRKIEQEEGELVEINRAAIKQQKLIEKAENKHARLIEQSKCETLEDLLAYAKEKGYKEGWAKRIYEIRGQKKQEYFNNKNHG